MTTGNEPQGQPKRISRIWSAALTAAYQMFAPTILSFMLGWLEVAYALGVAIVSLLIMVAVMFIIITMRYGAPPKITDPDSLIQIQLSMVIIVGVLLFYAAWSLAEPQWEPLLWVAKVLAGFGSVIPLVHPVWRLIARWHRG